jgi:predicted PurR-regulated permease PerM
VVLVVGVVVVVVVGVVVVVEVVPEVPEVVPEVPEEVPEVPEEVPEVPEEESEATELVLEEDVEEKYTIIAKPAMANKTSPILINFFPSKVSDGLGFLSVVLADILFSFYFRILFYSKKKNNKYTKYYIYKMYLLYIY